MPSLKKQALHGVFWSFTERFGQLGVQFINGVILERLPFLREATLRNALQQVVDGGHDSAVGVTRGQHYIWKDGRPTYDKKNIPNSFTLPEIVEECMGLYVN